VDFELSEDQELLRRGLRDLLERECPASRVRATAYDGDGRDAALWRSLAGAGWTGVAVPDEAGGAALKFEDVVLVVAEAGRSVVPLPLTTTVVASRALTRAGNRALTGSLLRRIAAGDASVTIALHDEEGHVVAEERDDGRVYSGVSSFVPYGPLAQFVLLEAGAGLALLPSDSPGLTWTDVGTTDRAAPLYTLSLRNVRLTEADLLTGGPDGGEAVERLRLEWTAALAAESLGAAERLLEMSIAYAKERVQFGRPVGANQAVKNRLADMGAVLERMRAAVYHAAVKIDAQAGDAALAVAMAKSAASRPAAWLGSQAIHVHGGVGFTWEHDLHLYFKRIKSNELLLGDTNAQLMRVAEAVLA
jgi:alkylation response protein AidB-like acyl-CoA dehydrogenase